MVMLYTDEIQADVIRHKMRAVLAAIVESMTDNDEALDDKREAEELEYQDGFTFTSPAALSFYSSMGSGTPMIDSLVQRHLDAQGREWASQFPSRASLSDCATDDGGEFQDEAQQWDDAALNDETIYIRVEVINDHGRIKFTACFTDEINAPHGVEYLETIDESAFLALDGDELESLANRVAEAPYLSLVTVQNSGGMWCGWFGTANGSTAYHDTAAHATEAEAREAVERAARGGVDSVGVYKIKAMAARARIAGEKHRAALTGESVA